MKKFTSFLLALVLVCLSIVPAFAAQGCNCGHTPLVVVGGMNGFPMDKDAGTPNEIEAWPPAIDFGELAVEAVMGLAASAVSLDWNKLGDRLVPLANKILEASACDADGNSKYVLTTTTFPLSMAHYPDYINSEGKNVIGLLRSACDRLGADHVYYFNYDWRLDPLEHAKELNRMIQRAKAETGHSKVDLTACSLGGALTLAYLAQFGYDDVDSCLFLSSVFSGSISASEILTGQITIDKTALKHYLRLNVNSDKNLDYALDAVVEILDQLGLLERIVDFLNGMLYALKDRVIKEVMVDTMGTMPGMWALVREDSYEQAKSDLIGDAKYATLVARIDDFHYNVRQKRQEIIEDAMRSGVKVFFTSHYEDALIPAFPSAIKHGDGLIETVCTSAGATVALLGETLSEDYIQANDCNGKNYISPDRVIDASTCMFPEQVWFFREVAHIGTFYDSEFNDFIFWLLEQEEQPTVWTDAAHPQFMAAGDKGMTLHPTTLADGNQKTVADYVAAVFDLIAQLRRIPV
ncbi:MAG: hypothetical protein GXZ02_06070 [Clostridiales bacterium]|nr:hypothetical protein [Clostridiales bacterium]